MDLSGEIVRRVGARSSEGHQTGIGVGILNQLVERSEFTLGTNENGVRGVVEVVNRRQIGNPRGNAWKQRLRRRS